MINRTGAYERAIEIVKAALAGGQIKLEGATSVGNSKGQLAADTEYLNGLINSLAENIINHANK